MVWDNDGFFGGMFDFNGDGQTDAVEASLGYQILDENEYSEHAKQMEYSDEVRHIVEKQMEELIRRMEKGVEPFNEECIEKYYHQYLDMIG